MYSTREALIERLENQVLWEVDPTDDKAALHWARENGLEGWPYIDEHGMRMTAPPGIFKSG